MGLRICVPRACSGRIYTIRQGDTMVGIAQNFGVSYQALLQANPQISDPNNIFIGQNICIPRRS
ncbi:MAG: LysM domain-containing protein [Dehalobacterium sp.]